MNIKWKIILIFMLLIICICGVFISFFISDNKTTLNKIVDTEISGIKAIAKNIEQGNSRFYRNRINSFVSYKVLPKREKLISAFARKDRNELLLLAGPYLKIFKQENPYFSTFAWITQDNHIFLRVHNPEVFGDKIARMRPDIVEVNTKQQPNHGYTVGKRGIAYRVVQPVFYKDQHIGAVQFGIKSKQFLDIIHTKLKHPVGIAIPNEISSVITISKTPSLTSDTHTIQSIELNLFQQNFDKIDWTLNYQKLVLQGKSFLIINVFNLLNYKQESQGYIFVALDISEHEERLQSRIILIILSSLALMLISFLILYISYSFLIQKIIDLNKTLEQSNDDLENQVEERTTQVRQQLIEQKQAENALRESEKKYRSMMESMKNASYICSSELKIEYMNPAMINRVGTDATGEICHKSIYDRDEKCSWCVFDQIQKGESIDYEVIDPKDNQYYSVTNSPIFHSTGTVSKLTIFHNITEIKNIEAQLHQSRKMESIGTLTGGIAHDFNNLLFMISGNTEIALDDTPDWNPVHQNLQEIKTASLKAAGIVKQLLHFSRKTDQQLKPIGAVTVIKDSIKFLRSTIPSNIKIQTQFPDTEIPILADSIQINQIMMNICINASHAMEETGGTLKINIETSSLDKEAVNNYPDLTIADNYLKITLSDTGPGIPSEIISQIFDPYFTTKDFGKGSGMGLTVVQGIVKNHDGAITVSSEVGKGAAFTILFAVIDEAPEIITNETATLPHGTETILFVDDEKVITNMMQQMLGKLGYQVEAKLNPEEALDLFQSKSDSFDIVITDMTMPQMTGAKFAKKLKEIRSDIPIILCTGHSSLIDEDKARQYGISGYLMKPVSKSKITKAIREVLDK